MRGFGSDAVSVVSPTWVKLHFSIQLYVLSSPYLCFIDLYVLGDNSLIRYGSFMRTKHLCILIHVRTKGEIGTVKIV